MAIAYGIIFPISYVTRLSDSFGLPGWVVTGLGWVACFARDSRVPFVDTGHLCVSDR